MSTKPKVVLTYPIHPEVIRKRLAPRARIVYARTPAALRREIRDAEGLITLLSDPVSEALLEIALRLKAVGNCAVGVDNIDLEACARRGVAVINTPDVLTRATAEVALTLLLAAAKRLPEGEELCRSGRFTGWRPDLLLGLELRGRRAVLVGRGKIGRETEKLFRGIGLRTEWITRQDSDSSVARKLQGAQILSLHIPLNASTRHWLSAGRIALLPHDAIVINTTRGPTVDEKALIRALKARRIFAAGLDVFEKEPFIPAALRSLPNVVLLPHLGSATTDTRAAMATLAIDGVLAILSGKRPWNEVNPIRTWQKTQDTGSSSSRTARAKPPRR